MTASAASAVPSPAPAPARLTGAADPTGRADALVRWVLPLATLVFGVATARGYGVFRDELYYLACARHLDWGYVDHPPMVAVVAALVGWLFGESWLALRMVSALAFAATVLLVGDTTRALGGGAFARVTAQLVTAGAPIYLALFAVYSMNGLDVLIWAGLARIAVALLGGGDPRLWLAFGALAGIGLQTKFDVGLLGVGLAVGLVLSRRDVFAGRWVWIGGAVAALLFLPHVLWQLAHDLPTREFVANAQAGKITALSPFGYVASQLDSAGPVGFLTGATGLAWLLGAGAARRFRPLGWAVLVVLGVFAFSVSKPYYFAPAFAVLFPAAAVAIERLGGRTRGRIGGGTGAGAGASGSPASLAVAAARWRTPLRAVVIVAAVATFALAPLARPLLPVDSYLTYAGALGLRPDSSENHELGRLPQFFADMHGWEELARSVAAVHAALPPADRGRACIYAQNYGEAGAIDFFGPALGLPSAMSGHNSYWHWGPGSCSGVVVLMIGGDGEDHARNFAGVELAGVHRCSNCMPYENELPLWVARDLKVPIADAWVGSRHYD